jgi:glycosyltransferase involved in cell wall biosynthesis
MKICIVANTPGHGGVSSYLMNVVGSLVKHEDVEVEVLFPKSLKNKDLKKAEVSNLAFFERKYGNKVKVSDNDSRSITRNDAFLIITAGMASGLDPNAETLMLRKPNVAVVHSLEDFTSEDPIFNPSTTLMADERYNTFLVHKKLLEDDIPLLLEQMRGKKSPKPTILYHTVGIDLPEEDKVPKNIDKPNNAIWYSRMDFDKGALKILKSIDLIMSKYDKFFMLTNFNKLSKYSRMRLLAPKYIKLAQKKYGDRFQFIPSYNTDSLVKYLNQSKVFLYPSSYNNAGYPFDFVIYEALANKVVPVIDPKVDSQQSWYKGDKNLRVLTFNTDEDFYDHSKPLGPKSLAFVTSSDNLDHLAETNYQTLKEFYPIERFCSSFLSYFKSKVK